MTVDRDKDQYELLSLRDEAKNNWVSSSKEGLAGLLMFAAAILWAASWVVSIVLAFGVSTATGVVFFLLGLTGPVAGLIEGIAYGQWLALFLGAAALALVTVSASLSEK